MYLKDKTEIHFNKPDELTIFSKFKQRVFDKTTFMLKIKTKQWAECVNNFRHFMKVVDTGDTTTKQRMRSWIQSYLDDRAEIEMKDSVENKDPFVHKGHWHIYPERFRNWAYQNKGQLDGVSNTELDLKIVGANKERYGPPNPNKPGKRSTIWPWKIPHDIYMPSTVTLKPFKGKIK